MINVVATQQGYYGHYRNVNDEFLITDASLFSRDWMRPKSKDDVKKLAAGMKALEKKAEVIAKAEPEEDDFGLSEGEDKPVIRDELDTMDKEALIDYGRANCIGLTLTRAMNEDTIRDRIRDYAP
jgi:hypothetical protein